MKFFIPQPCKDDKHCGHGAVCIDNFCDLASCFKNADCNDDESCVDGECVSPPECTSNANCPYGKVCSDEGECTNCKDDSECNIGQECIYGSCKDAGCNDDRDCLNGQICVENKCIVGQSCHSSRDCSSTCCIDNICKLPRYGGDTDTIPDSYGYDEEDYHSGHHRGPTHRESAGRPQRRGHGPGGSSVRPQQRGRGLEHDSVGSGVRPQKRRQRQRGFGGRPQRKQSHFRNDMYFRGHKDNAILENVRVKRQTPRCPDDEGCSTPSDCLLAQFCRINHCQYNSCQNHLDCDRRLGQRCRGGNCVKVCRLAYKLTGSGPCKLRTNKFHYLTMFTNLGIETNALVDMYAETDDVSNHVADQETVNLQIQNAQKVFVA